MSVDLKEFYQDLFQDILNSADADGQFVEDEFFRIVCDQLIDAGELETADRSRYVLQRGSLSLRVDGYGGDPTSSDGVLSLIVVDFDHSPDIGTLTATEMDAAFRRLTSFLNRALNADFRDALEETHSSFGLAELIAARWSQTLRVRLILISNRMLSTRVDGRSAGQLDGIPVSYNVWDIGRLHRYATSDSEREDFEVDLEKELGGGLVVLPAHLDQAGYEAYLAVVPGKQLAAIYGRWGAKLLEQNVRVFLQARGNVNRGIRNTIEHNPAMFFAYNNGITATAEAVDIRETDGGLLMTLMKNFQIVNGGQTTASIFAASRNRNVDLSKVFVQMKLSIVEPTKAPDIIPKISEYANSQNRVSASDFFANHPYHVRMEQFSRRLYAPSLDGNFRESKWFYERARGQYRDERGRRTEAETRRFDLEYPKRQVFAKTDLAKFLNVWRGRPEIVSRGAQKNFADFADEISKHWERSPNDFNEAYFRHSVAKAIIFRDVEKLVTGQSWYQGGYRANVVAYAIAKLANDLDQRQRVLDFEKVWRAQAVSSVLRDALTIAATTVHDVIVNPPPTQRNVTEWAKRESCWTRVKSLEVNWPDELDKELLTTQEEQEARRTAVRDQRMLNGIEAQAAVVNAGTELWRDALNWGMAKGLLSPSDVGVFNVAASVPARVPTEAQSKRAIETLKRLQDEGCQIGLDVV